MEEAPQVEDKKKAPSGATDLGTQNKQQLKQQQEQQFRVATYGEADRSSESEIRTQPHD